MKLLAYFAIFAFIVGVAGLGFFMVSPPRIPQTQITKTLDPRTAFAPAPSSISPAAP